MEVVKLTTSKTSENDFRLCGRNDPQPSRPALQELYVKIVLEGNCRWSKFQ